LIVVNRINDIALNAALGRTGNADGLVVNNINSVRFTRRTAEHFLPINCHSIVGVHSGAQFRAPAVNLDSIAVN